MKAKVFVSYLCYAEIKYFWLQTANVQLIALMRLRFSDFSHINAGREFSSLNDVTLAFR